LRRRALTLFAVALGAGALGLGCEGRPRAASSAPSAAKSKSGPSVVVFDLTAGAPEKASSGIFGVSQGRTSFDELVSAFDDLKKNKEAASLLVRFGGSQLGLGRAEELGAMLDGFRKSGKPVFCHADGYTNATLLAASRGCSKIYVSPAGEVEAVGIAAQIVYMHKLLVEELHISLDILQVGKFKGAEEPLTRDGPSDEARASLEGVLADLRATWASAIKEGRGRPELAAAIEDGPYSPKKAKERGLVDEIGYADDALEAEKKASGGYYLASTGSLILADKTSIVGSIGVVGGKVAVGGALERFGIHTETFSGQPGNVPAANRAAYLSPLVPWDEPTKVRVLESMSGIYDLFLQRISEGRSTQGRTIGVEKIAPFAEGRIFSGQQGKERGLVDELGGLREAIVRARELAKLPGDAEVAVMGNKPGILEALGGSGGQDAEERAASMRAAAAPDPIDALGRIAPDLVPFVASMAPLADGERSLCALPFALVVK
jgi:ClpP class serine protease